MSAWLRQVFKALAVSKGGIVRRNIGDVRKYCSVGEVKREAMSRGYHVVVSGDQVIVLCNPGNVRILC
jgi:hypothetical protein